jgi:hypothetical protein
MERGIGHYSRGPDVPRSHVDQCLYLTKSFSETRTGHDIGHMGRGGLRVAEGARSWLDDHGRDLDHALGGALHDRALDGDPGALGHA